MSKSDYEKKRHNLYELLPEVFQNPTSESIIENTFNRFLSKPEFERVVGYAGQGNKRALRQRQIVEDTPHRQAFQLQPTVYNKIGTVEKIYTFEDIMKRAKRHGIDVDNFDYWGEAREFNWIPPINIDKFINYQNYYWVADRDQSPSPDYITIQNPCNVETEKVARIEVLINRYGGEFNIKSIKQTAPDSEDPSLEFARITLNGNLTALFAPEFTFFIKDTGSNDVDNLFHTVVKSEYNTATNITTIYIETPVNEDINLKGIISFVEFLDLLRKGQSCLCGDSIGWGLGLFDDNQIESPPPSWLTVLVGLGTVAYASADPVNDQPDKPMYSNAQYGTIYSPNWQAELNKLWYNPTNDTLYQFKFVDGATQTDYENSNGEWVLMIPNVSTTIDLAEGIHNWDKSDECGIETNQWQDDNLWVHRSAVKNFTTAKQAGLPILEYIPSLELNQWIETKPIWQYRKSKGAPWSDTTAAPLRVELYEDGLKFVEMKWQDRYFVFEYTYGDLSDEFAPGVKFNIDSTFEDLNKTYTVETSRHEKIAIGVEGADDAKYRTIITVKEAVPSPEESGSIIPINTLLPKARPHKTSRGDSWIDYHQHWLYTGQTDTRPINQQPRNPFLDLRAEIIQVPAAGGRGAYVFQSNIQVQEFRSFSPQGENSFPLDVVLAKYEPGLGNVRVYVDGIRQYGNYDEGLNGNGHVDEIIFHDNRKFGNVRVEVGPASFDEIGLEQIPVRTIASEETWVGQQKPLETKNLATLYKFEQVKNQQNQYPRFDIYDALGNTLYEANEIFRYKEDQNAPLNRAVKRRIVTDPVNRDYTFEQLLVDQDDGPIKTFRDYTLDVHDAWYNTADDELKAWTGNTWHHKTFVGNLYTAPRNSFEAPEKIYRVNGMLWYDKTSNLVRRYNKAGAQWDIDSIAAYNPGDPTVQSIWRKGLNDEKYTPQWVDKDREPLTKLDPNGYWEIPKQLYYNVEHRNRREITSTDLTAHFTTIINNQGAVPGFSGNAADLFNLLQIGDVNFGVGGTIKNFNGLYDTFISAVINESTSVPGLIDFARDQYSALIFALQTAFRENVANVLIDSKVAFDDINKLVAEKVVDLFELNQYYKGLYGDSPTFNVDEEVGIKNWIATLPFFSIIDSCEPNYIEDPIHNIKEIFHHDQHYARAALTNAEISRVMKGIITLPDPRRINDDTNQPEKIGVTQPTLPAKTLANYKSKYNIDDEKIYTNVFWLFAAAESSPRLFMFKPTYLASGQPTLVDSKDGDTWYRNKAGSEGLYVRKTINNVAVWDFVTPDLYSDGLFDDAEVNAWIEIDFNRMLQAVILEAETKLHEAAQLIIEKPLVIDLDEERLKNPDRYEAKLKVRFQQYLQRRFDNCTVGFESDYVPTDPFTWNYKHSVIQQSRLPKGPIKRQDEHDCGIENAFDWSTYDASIPNWQAANLTYFDRPEPERDWWGLQGGTFAPYLMQDISGGYWKDVYQKVYNTPYPHLQPWMLQGYCSKPDYWDERYADTTGDRRWTKEMWTDRILPGIIPVGDTAPDGRAGNGLKGQAPRYTRVSVNIEDETVIAANGLSYEPDDVLPPYAPRPIAGASENTASLFEQISDIQRPHVKYEFGDAGRVEWEWRNSISFNYDRLAVSFQLSPLRTLQKTFGIKFNDVAGLLINRANSRLYSHKRARFHGDLKNETEIENINGLNQWYINFNRYGGYDASYSDFRQDWINWSPQLGYAFGGFTDDETINIYSTYFELTDQDYDITTKRTKGANDLWADSLQVNVTNIPLNDNARLFDNDGNWNFTVNTCNPLCLAQTYYEVRDYQFQYMPEEQVGVMYQYDIIDVNVSRQYFAVKGDKTTVFSKNPEVVVVKSLDGTNDGDYTIKSAVFNRAADRTEIYTNETITRPNVSGKIIANYYDLPFQTGDAVQVFSENGKYPHPIIPAQDYYIIKHNSKVFSIAQTKALAERGERIHLDDIGSSVQFRLQQLKSTFNSTPVNGNKYTWKRFELDKRHELMLENGHKVVGIQPLLNLIDGFEGYQADQGIKPNEGRTERDEDTSLVTSWLSEMIRLIDLLFDGRTRAQIKNENYYTVRVDNQGTGRFEFIDTKPSWGTGTLVELASTDGMPAPLKARHRYYLMRLLEPTKFYLADKNGDAITLTSSGSGELRLQPYAQRFTPKYTIEVNPYRYNLGYHHTLGILSDVVEGPSKDFRVEQTIYDQKGNKIPAKRIGVQRFDKLSSITHRKGLRDDSIPVIASNVITDQYNDLHICGAHLFTDEYEQILLFNDYSQSGSLIYDSFIGLNTPKFEMEFLRQQSRTLRPSIGGGFLHENKVKRNFEGALELQRNYFDTVDGVESREDIRQARESMGYDGPFDYLNKMNINQKSQFHFWQGMIESKGTTQTIKAFINSRRFVDAKVDEFWAYKETDYGDSRLHDEPELKLYADDSKLTNLKFEFTTVNADESTFTEGFEQIDILDNRRWFNQPLQQDIIGNDQAFNIFAEISSSHDIPDPTNYMNAKTRGVYDRFYLTSGRYYYKTDIPCDGIIITYYDQTSERKLHVKQENQNPGASELYIKKVNSKVYELVNVSGSTWDDKVNIAVHTINPAYSKHSPFDVVDKLTHTVVSPAIMFDPARNQLYHNAEHEIDLLLGYDPAKYMLSIRNGTTLPDNAWLDPEVGKTWLDTSTFGFEPYYDEKVFPNINARMNKWGSLAPWSVPRLYQWIKSPVPPEQYDTFAQSQSQNPNIPEEQKASGKAKKTLYFRERRKTNFTVNPGSRASIKVPFDTSVYGLAQFEDQTGLIENQVETFTFRTGDGLTFNLNNRYIPGVKTLIVTVNGSVLPSGNVTEVDETTFTLTGITLNDYDVVTANIVSPVYSIKVVVDEPVAGDLSNYRILKYSGNNLQTFEDLITRLQADLPDLDVTLADDGIVFTSKKAGGTSYVTVEDNVEIGETAGLFLDMINIDSGWTGSVGTVIGQDTTFTTTVPLNFKQYEAVIVNTKGKLPEGMSKGARYLIDVINPNTFKLETLTRTSVTLADAGTGTHTIGAATFTELDGTVKWKISKTVHQAFDVSLLYPDGQTAGLTGFELVLDSTIFNENDIVNVYINEQPKQALVPVVNNGGNLEITISKDVFPQDTIRVTRFEYILTPEDESFDPDSFDDGSRHVHFKNQYEFSYKNEKLPNGQIQRFYYFWAENQIARSRGEKLSQLNTLVDLFNVPTPYVIAANLNIVPPYDPADIAGTYKHRNAKKVVDNCFYDQMVIRNHNKILTDDNRFTLRMKRDFTMKDRIADNGNAKPVHEEWKMIRREQPLHPPKALWDRMIESIIGYKLNDSSIAVPEVSKVVYDNEFGTTTRYGIQPGQSFVDGEKALNTILTRLQDPTIDYFPIIMERYFENNDFTTPEGIRAALVELYNTFASQRVNDIFFEVLEDAFIDQSEYKDIFKTSWLALHGIRIIETPTLFDD